MPRQAIHSTFRAFSLDAAGPPPPHPQPYEAVRPASLPSPWASASRTGLRALDQFPMDILRRTAAGRLRRASVRMLAYGDPQGYLPLREAIAAHLGASRGVRCDASRVMIVNGAQGGITLCA